MGDRAGPLRDAVRSLAPSRVLVVANGVGGAATATELGLDVVGDTSRLSVIGTDENLGVPGGRDHGVRHTNAEIVGFLDDDAVASPGLSEAVAARFDDDAQLGAIALRIVDEDGRTVRRHVPRFGSLDPERSGPVALFLGGACAIRRSAYDEVGGYFTDLHYGHEEVELAWRLIDAGWNIEYLADVTVEHPRTEISRHERGWELTGRNRVWIAVRTLPRPASWAHALAWLLLGLRRTPDRATRDAYASGWRSGWRTAPHRTPISWRGVWRLTRRGRPPIL
mgnify:CR=1 FL=1